MIAAWLGWRFAFFIPAVFFVVTGFAYLAFVPDDRGKRVVQAPDQDVALSKGLTIAVVVLFLMLAFWVGLVFNAITIMLPKLVQQRVGSGFPLAQVGVLATAVFLCGGVAQFSMGRAVERITPHLVMSFIAGIQVIGMLLAIYTSGWWLLPSLALAVAAIYGQVTVNDFVLARYTPPAWRGRIYAIRFFLIFTMAGPAAWGIGRLYEQGGFNIVLGVGAVIAVLGALNTFAISALVTGAENRRASERARGRRSAGRVSTRLAFAAQAQYPLCSSSTHRSPHAPSCSVAVRRSVSQARSVRPMRRPRNRPNPRARVRKQHKNRQPRRPIRARASSATICRRQRRSPPRPRSRPPQARSAPCASRRGRRSRPLRRAARATARDVAACAQAKDNDAAIAGCTRVIDDSKVKPKGRAAAFYNRGNAHTAKGDLAAAIADYDEAIKLDPKNASAFNNRGTAHSDKGDADAALADFDEAIKRNPRLCVGLFQSRQCPTRRGRTRIARSRITRRDQVRPAQRQCLYRARRALSRGRRGRRRAPTWRSPRGSTARTPMRCCGTTSRSGARSRRAFSRAAPRGST